MNWGFLLKTAVALVIIVCGTLYLRREDNNRFTFVTFLLSALLVFPSVIVATAVEPKAQLPEKVSVRALDQKNEKAKETTIYLTGLFANREKAQIETATDASWYWQNNWYVWRAPEDSKNPGGLSQTIELLLPAGTDRKITFLANEFKGLVKITYKDTEQILDCYSPEKKTLEVSLPDSPPAVMKRASLFQRGVSLLLILALSVPVFFAADWVRRGKLRLPAGGKKLSPVTYDRDDATALKGIAILIMLMHHLFLSGRFDGYEVSFAPFSARFGIQLASYCKICVSLFSFVSGYGLFLSYRKKSLSDKKWIALRYIKSFSGFWIIVVLSWIVCQIINGRTAEVYFEKNVGTGLVSMLLEITGLTGLFGSPQICGTWWYMSAALVFILLMPLVGKKDGQYLPALCMAACVFIRVISGGKMAEYYNTYLGGSNPYSFLMPFLIGALFAKYDFLVRIANARYRWLRFVVELLLLAGSCKLYQMLSTPMFFDIKWGLLPLPVILLSVEYVIPRRLIHKFLVFMGRHSMNIFLIHTFVRATYLQSFVYSFGHFLLIFLVLLLISLALSFVVEWLKKMLRYEDFVDSVCVWIGEKDQKTAGQEKEDAV